MARTYLRGRRASAYLGREFEEADVRRAARALVSNLEGPGPDPSATDPAAVDALIRDLMEREHDPSRRAAAQAIAALVRRGRVAHRA